MTVPDPYIGNIRDIRDLVVSLDTLDLDPAVRELLLFAALRHLTVPLHAAGLLPSPDPREYDSSLFRFMSSPATERAPAESPAREPETLSYLLARAAVVNEYGELLAPDARIGEVRSVTFVHGPESEGPAEYTAAESPAAETAPSPAAAEPIGLDTPLETGPGTVEVRMLLLQDAIRSAGHGLTIAELQAATGIQPNFMQGPLSNLVTKGDLIRTQRIGKTSNNKTVRLRIFSLPGMNEPAPEETPEEVSGAAQDAPGDAESDDSAPADLPADYAELLEAKGAPSLPEQRIMEYILGMSAKGILVSAPSVQINTKLARPDVNALLTRLLSRGAISVFRLDEESLPAYGLPGVVDAVRAKTEPREPVEAAA